MSAFWKVMDYLGLGPASAYGDEPAPPAPRWQRGYAAVGVTVMVVTLVLTRNWIITWIVSLAFMVILLGPSIIKDRRHRVQASEHGASDDPR